MKKLLKWIFISPILLFLMWLAFLKSESFRDNFILCLENSLTNTRKEMEEDIKRRVINNEK